MRAVCRRHRGGVDSISADTTVASTATTAGRGVLRVLGARDPQPELRGRFAEIHRRVQVPIATALERVAAERGVELPDDALPLAVASGAMQIGWRSSG